jgi:amino acid transporter
VDDGQLFHNPVREGLPTNWKLPETLLSLAIEICRCAERGRSEGIMIGCCEMSESQRDAGLVRAIGPWGLAANIINSVVGAGIFAVPGALAACLGPYAPLAFLVCAVAIGSVAICFAEGGSRMPTSGGAYGYVEAAFGPLAGYVAGTLLWLGDVLACGGVAAALADAAVGLLPPSLQSLVHAAVIIAVIGGVALVNIGGVARGAQLVDLATMLKLIPLAIFVIAGARAVHSANFVQTLEPNTQGMGRALILALFVFTGMEVSLSASGEVAQPHVRSRARWRWPSCR